MSLSVVGCPELPMVADSSLADSADSIDSQVLADGVDGGGLDPGPLSDATTDSDAPIAGDVGDGLNAGGDASDAGDSVSELPDLADATPDSGTPGDASTDADVDLSICLTEGASCQTQFNLPCQEGRCDSDLLCAYVPIEGCCYQDSDCDLSQNSGCLEMRCVSNECTLLTEPGCCDAGTPCAQGGCGTTSCIDGRCNSCPSDDGTCQCPSNPIISQAGFGGTTELLESGFFVTDYDTEDAVTWSVVTHRWSRPPAALYLGDPLCRTYYNGALGADCQPLTDGSDATAVKMLLYSPTINLSGGFNTSGAGKVALFALWADVEDVAGPADRLTITVDNIGAQFVSWPVATSEFVGKDTDGQWRIVAVDLSPFEGYVVRLRLEFDTLDSQDNSHEGLYLDDWQVVDRCAGGGCCTSDDDCSLVGPADPCLAARCVQLADGGGSVCATVAATPGEPCQACAQDVDCDDGNPCTADSCSADGTCDNQVFCCLEEVALDAGFEPGEDDLNPPPALPDGWTVTDLQPEDAVTWRRDATSPATEGAWSLWCGDHDTGTYGTDGPVTVSIQSATVDVPPILPGPGSIVASFWVQLDTEWTGASSYENPLGVDRLSVSIVTPNGELELWSSDLIMGTTSGAWVPVTLDVSLWAGQQVGFRFLFDSVDDASNAFGGPRIDAFRVQRSCL